MNSNKMNRENFITIQGWIVIDLNLKGNELLIYALIYGFCQDKESKFQGSHKYISKWINSSKNTVIKSLKSLMEKELIIKHETRRKNQPRHRPGDKPLHR